MKGPDAIPLRSRRMIWNLVPRTGFEPAPPVWEAGMLTVDNTGTGGCGDREYASRAREGQGV